MRLNRLFYCFLVSVFYFLPALNAQAGELKISHQLPATNRLTQASPASSSTQPPPPRIRPNFSEEERKNFNQRGFKNTFLLDSLNGLSDPLGGGTAGTGFTGNDALSPLSPQQRGIAPGFDPTDVIIPRSGLER